MKAELQGWCGSACAGKFLAGTVVAQARQLAPFHSTAQPYQVLYVARLQCTAGLPRNSHQCVPDAEEERTLSFNQLYRFFQKEKRKEKTKHTKIHQK